MAYTAQVDSITDEARADLIATGDPARDVGLEVEYGGEATQATAAQSPTEALGVLVALLVLAITFGSLLAAGLPLLTALIGVGVGMAGVIALSAVVDLTSTAPTLGLMIGLAVGIDYALFISIRHKQQLAEGMAAEESAARAVGTAGSAVVFAGATVMIALAGLSVVGIPFLTAMGLVAAGMVAVAVLVALTLVPALLGFAGDRFSRWPVPGLRRRQAAPARAGESDRAPAGPGLVTAARSPSCWPAVIGLGVLALPALDLQLGLPDDGNLTAETTQRQAYDLLSDGFGPGFNGPLTVVVDASGAADTEAAAPGRRARDPARLPDVAAVAPGRAQPGRRHRRSSPSSRATGPADASTKDLVGAIRDPAASPRPGPPERELYVTGNTALGIDISDKLTARAAAVPAGRRRAGTAAAARWPSARSWCRSRRPCGFLLSLAATFGALVAVFQWGWLAGLLGVAADRSDHELPADLDDRPALRPGDGLRGLPGHPDARGATCTAPARARPSSAASGTAPGWSPPRR